MEIQFGTNTPIRDDIEVALDQAQKPVKIVLRDRTRKGNFVVVVRDPDAPHPDYIHLLIVNCSANDLSQGDVLLSYYPPQRVDHRYHFEVYTSVGKIERFSIGRERVNFERLALNLGLRKLFGIIVTTTEPNASWFPLQNRYCRCILHEHSKSNKSNVRECQYLQHDKDTFCGNYESFDNMPHDHLVAYAKLEGIKLTDPSNTRKVIEDIKKKESF